MSGVKCQVSDVVCNMFSSKEPYVFIYSIETAVGAVWYWGVSNMGEGLIWVNFVDWFAKCHAEAI